MKYFNNCPVMVKLCLLLTIYLNLFGSHLVFGATCTSETNLTCVATDFTLATCVKETCNCKPDYLPIPTGCTAKLLKPILKLQPGRTAEFLPGADVELTCSTLETGAVTIEWRRNNEEVKGVNSKDYVIKGGDDDIKIGSFSCLVRVDSLSLVSEPSDPTEITLANLTIAAESVTPELIFPNQPTDAVPGAVHDAVCSQIPYGVSSKFMFNGTEVVEFVTQDTSANFSCILNPYKGVEFIHNESASVGVPSRDATEIISVKLNIQESSFYKTGTKVSVSCSIEPSLGLLKDVTYTFQVEDPDASAGEIFVNKEHSVESVAGKPKNVSITCNATLNSNNPVSSITATLIFSDDYITTPNLIASKNEVKVGSSVYLTCGEHDTRDVTYTWTKDNQVISRQRDRIIQYGNYQDADKGKFYCTAIRDTYQAVSNTVEVKSNAQTLHVLGSTILILVAVVTAKIF
uniref:Ig-like domain-containing protein n=1 Tax=Arion vulgaris TaxID=1028688 RepID=A0A0B6ZEK4_9EUPU